MNTKCECIFISASKSNAQEMSRFFWYSLEKLSTVYLELAVRVNVHCFQAWWIIGINLATFRKLDSKAQLLEALLCWIGAELRNERF